VPRRDIGVIIVAGGSSTRTGGEELKQFTWVAGKPMLLHSVQTFMAHPDVCSVVCVLPPQYAGDPPPWLFQCDVDRLLLSIGGRTRSESVANGLDDLPDEAEIVLVHDAARPLVSDEVVERVLAPLSEGWDGAVPGLPVGDTLKRVGPDGGVQETVSRDGLWAVQTPQAFAADRFRQVLASNSLLQATDCAGLVEAAGGRVKVVEGDQHLLKVTSEADLETVAGWR
jgi:2-C-methyl-D-erythritol 4-phosphate cytidylyltransferase